MVTRPGRRAAASLTASWLVVIALATLWPAETTVTLPASCIFCGQFGGVDFALNVVLFVPLGVALRWLLGSWRSSRPYRRCHNAADRNTSVEAHSRARCFVRRPPGEHVRDDARRVAGDGGSSLDRLDGDSGPTPHGRMGPDHSSHHSRFGSVVETCSHEMAAVGAMGTTATEYGRVQRAVAGSGAQRCANSPEGGPPTVSFTRHRHSRA